MLRPDVKENMSPQEQQVWQPMQAACLAFTGLADSRTLRVFMTAKGCAAVSQCAMQHKRVSILRPRHGGCGELHAGYSDPEVFLV